MTVPDAEGHSPVPQTLVELGSERLAALCGAAGPPGESEAFRRLFRQIASPWGDREIGVRPRCPSYIADDQAPFEFAIAISDGSPEVQFYVEVQGEPPTMRSNMVAGRARLEAIARELGAPLDRLRLLEPLFFPQDPQAPFALWIGASWMRGRGVKLKSYLNPQVRGRDGARELVAEAMDRLGFARAWTAVEGALSSSSRDGRHDEVAIVSLELSNADDARLKVYIRHHGATVTDIESIARLTEDYHSGDATAFYAPLARIEGPHRARPALTELAFLRPGSQRPAAITIELPIGSHVQSDQEAAERIRLCLAAFELPSDVYDRALNAFATRPLGERTGIHAHVTLSRVRGRPRVAVYLASDAYPPAESATPPRAEPPKSGRLQTPPDDYHQVSEYYRRAIDGHVYIRETIEALLETVGDRVRGLAHRPRILELGSHAGVITERLLDCCPGAEIVVSDDNAALVAMSRRRLAGRRVEYHLRPLEALADPVDLVISVARHHHLPHDYLAGVRRLLKPEGLYVLGDELCPEYCEGDQAARIEHAPVLHIAGGYVLTSPAEVAAFTERGALPDHALDLEKRRQRALWRWYRFVVDQAVERGYFDIAASELQSTRDDLVTGSDAEHKFSPLVVERQFALAGFRRVSKRLIGPSDQPERQSMFVYEYALG